MVAFVRDYMSWWNPAPSSMTPEEIAEQVQSIVDRESDDLCESVDDFPVKVRTSFFEDCEVTEASAIPADEMEEFKQYLREYGV